MMEIKFLVSILVFMGTVTGLLTLALPTLGQEFEKFEIATPPSPPENWYDWPGYLVSVVGYFFGMIFTPELPTPYRFLGFIFTAFAGVMAYIIVKLIIELAKAIGALVPFT